MQKLQMYTVSMVYSFRNMQQIKDTMRWWYGTACALLLQLDDAYFASITNEEALVVDLKSLQKQYYKQKILEFIIMERIYKTEIMVTGGAGFIGSRNTPVCKQVSAYLIVNLDH